MNCIERMIRSLFVCTLVVFCVNTGSALQAAVPAEGGDLSRIVVADLNDPVQKAAADDLRRIFNAVTGQSIEISTDAGTGRTLYIGRGPDGVDLQPHLGELDEEGIYLAITPEHIICTGTSPKGVYNAVQELLYQMGYRSIWPGKYGECLPEGPSLKLGNNLEVARNPSFALRGGHSLQVEGLPGEKPQHINIVETVDWAGRNHINRLKAGYTTTYDYGAERAHGWQEICGHTIQDTLLPAGEFGKKFPEEWYALFNGKRVAKHPIGTTVQPCVSNPDYADFVTEQVRDYFRKNPTAHRYMIGHSDEPSYWCECDNCKALDPVQYSWVHENGTGQERYNMSDRWFFLVNTVAERIADEFPGKWISTYSYASTRELPLKREIAKNVMVEVTIPLVCRKHKLTDPNCPDNVTELRRLREWSQAAEAISTYSYLEFAHWGIPVSFYDSAADLYRTLHDMDVQHISDELDTSPNASPVYMALWGRLMWDVNTDADEYITEFCRIAYGAAAADMEAFWREQQEVMQNSRVAHRGYTDIERFAPDVIAKFYKRLDEARSRSLTEDQVARVERARMAMLMADYYISKDRAAKDRRIWTHVEKVREQIYVLSRDYKFAIDLFAWNALGGGEQMFLPVPVEIGDERYQMPIEALGGQTLVELPDEWHFRLDPDDVGEKNKWFAEGTSLSPYRLISTSSPWENQWPGAYDGYAWYITEVTIPKADGKRVWLLFGAVDETWKVWLAGNYIGASRGAPMDIWDKPAAVEISHKYPPDTKVRLVVRVHDSARLGGIWKPVTIVTSNE